jgi:hypothetical protein
MRPDAVRVDEQRARHTPAESTALEDCVRGASVPATALQRLAY